MADKTKKVVSIHLGSRAHYLIPKALEKKGVLEYMITDTWVPSKTVREILSKAPFRSVRALSGRFTEVIPNEKVRSIGLRFLIAEFFFTMFKKEGWDRTISRSRYFESNALKYFPLSNVLIFGTSYTSLQAFRIAKQRGNKTILFQIDPGKFEEDIVFDLLEQSEFRSSWARAPLGYWHDWMLECELSDIILVNSEWSKKALVHQGISEAKIRIIPLPIELKQKHLSFIRQYPSYFSKERPLKCLFLGTLTIRKGIHLVLEAARRLIDFPVEFVLVGPSEISNDELSIPSISYHGAVTSKETDHYFKTSDVFIFPTFSDGFGLTQLEAMTWKLPVIASERCGEVVKHGTNGWLIDLDADALVKRLINLLENPDNLEKASAECHSVAKEFDLSSFSKKLEDLI